MRFRGTTARLRPRATGFVPAVQRRGPRHTDSTVRRPTVPGGLALGRDARGRRAGGADGPNFGRGEVGGSPPLVAVVVGSRSDWATMRHVTAVLGEREVPHLLRVVSAHRTPERLFDFARSAVAGSHEVIVAGAGRGRICWAGRALAHRPLPEVPGGAGGNDVAGRDLVAGGRRWRLVAADGRGLEGSRAGPVPAPRGRACRRI
jgi:hypothetical protein